MTGTVPIVLLLHLDQKIHCFRYKERAQSLRVLILTCTRCKTIQSNFPVIEKGSITSITLVIIPFHWRDSVKVTDGRLLITCTSVSQPGRSIFPPTLFHSPKRPKDLAAFSFTPYCKTLAQAKGYDIYQFEHREIAVPWTAYLFIQTLVVSCLSLISSFTSPFRSSGLTRLLDLAGWKE